MRSKCIAAVNKTRAATGRQPLTDAQIRAIDHASTRAPRPAGQDGNAERQAA